LKKNPANDIRGIKGEEVRKDTLTLDEITKLTNTSIDDEVLKQAFLFMCFTGLRFIDVKNLKYGDIKNGDKYTNFIKTRKNR